MDEPNLVPKGAVESVSLPTIASAVLIYEDGTMRFAHRCDRGDRGVVHCAPLLQLDNGGHRVVQRDPLSIEPSVLCSDCGRHGWIRDGAWIEA